MNSHKHARLSYARRIEMVLEMIEQGINAPLAARKWLGRYLAGGEAALADASSRPEHSPRTIQPAKALLIVELRRRRMLQAKIASSVGVWASTVSRVLARAGLSKPQRSRAARAGAALRTRSARRSAAHRHQEARAHRAAQPPRYRQPARLGGRCGMGDAVRGRGRPCAHRLHGHAPGREEASGGAVPQRCGGVLRQTNGKAERFIQSALREWAYGWTYQNSAQRTTALAGWQHHYNWHRPHSGIGGLAPMSRLPASGNNVLTLHN